MRDWARAEVVLSVLTCGIVCSACSGSGAHLDITHVADVSGAGGLPGNPVHSVISGNMGTNQFMSSGQYTVFCSQSNLVAGSIPTAPLYQVTDPIVESAIAAQE